MLDSEEASGIIAVIHDFAYALDVLDGYDHESLEVSATSFSKAEPLTSGDAKEAIEVLRKQYKSRALFGREKDESFQSNMATIYQTFGGKGLYPSIEEKAANLLYFTVKNTSRRARRFGPSRYGFTICAPISISP